MPNFVGNGDTWTSTIANGSLNPILDGEIIPGHGEKLIDNHLSDIADQIKANFYQWFRNLEVSVLTGLSLKVSAGRVILSNGRIGTIAEIQPLLVPASSETIVAAVESGGSASIQLFTSIPVSCVPLALAVTDATGVTQLFDLRPPKNFSINTFTIPPQSETFRPGDIKYTLRETVDPGWLKCDFSFVSTTVFPNLFGVIGYRYGGSGNQFRLPPPNRYIVSGDTGIGPYLGNNEVTILEANLPPHAHGINQSPHTHTVNDGGHTHIANGQPHNHTINQSPHDHQFFDNGHTHALEPSIAWNARNPGQNYGSGGGLGLGPLSVLPAGPETGRAFTQGVIENKTIAISNNPESVNVSVNPSATGINLQPTNVQLSTINTGGGQALNIQPASIIANMWIKT